MNTEKRFLNYRLDSLEKKIESLEKFQQDFIHLIMHNQVNTSSPFIRPEAQAVETKNVTDPPKPTVDITQNTEKPFDIFRRSAGL